MNESQTTPLQDEQWPPVLEDLLGGFAGGLNVYRVMARHPALLRAWAPLRDHVVVHSMLAADLREVAILRIAHRWGSAYEWGQHVVRGRKAGLDDARIARARQPLDEALPDQGDDALIIDAIDALLDEGMVSPDTLATLTARLGQPAVFDLMALAGLYTTLAFVAKSFTTPLEPEIIAELAARPLSPG